MDHVGGGSVPRKEAMSTPQYPGSPQNYSSAPPPPNYPAPPQNYPGQPAAPPKNGFGITGFVLGLVGLLFSFIPFIGVIAWPLVIMGIIFGILGVLRVKKGVASNKAMSIIGIVVSAVGLIVCIIWTVVVGAAVSAINDDRLHWGETVEGGHTVEFVVTTEEKVEVLYGDALDNKTEVVQPGGEWRQKAGYKSGSHYMAVTATPVDGGDGKVGCQIMVDGKMVAEDPGDGITGMAVCSYDVK
jgi:hypothetical protein